MSVVFGFNMKKVPLVLLIVAVFANLNFVEALSGADATNCGPSGYAAKLYFAVILGALHQSRAVIQFDELPTEILQCWTDYINQTSTLWHDEHTEPVVKTEKEIYKRCMEKFMWKADRIRWSDYDVSEDNLAWLNSLLMPMIQSKRKKRGVGPDNVFPPSGFRIRREYRRLSDNERNVFHETVNILKRSGRYDIIANIHVGFVITQAHCGPNFYSWHRIYLIIMEEALRQIDRRVAIPYWDSSLDVELDDPYDSIIWSPPFLGNGDGFVRSGPFANWPVGNTTLLRNFGRVKILKLFTKEMIQLVLSQCHLANISVPVVELRYNLEYYHNGGHFVVGGHMANLETAVHDPVFFLHHSFVDYLLEQFRIQQVKRCRVNPDTDYPPLKGMHGPYAPMAGLPPFLNIDGFHGQWTKYWYRYEIAPFCSEHRPDCGTPYLRCNVKKGRCVAVARLITAEDPTGKMITAPPSTFKSLAAANAKRANKEQDSIMDFGPPMLDNSSYCKNVQTKRAMRFRRSLFVDTRAKSTNRASSSSKQSHFEHTVRPPTSNKGMSDVLGVSVASAEITSDPEMDLSFSFPRPMPLLPSIGGPVMSTSWRGRSQWQDGNTFAMYTSSLHIKEMVYIPIKIIHVAPSGTTQQSTYHSRSLPGSPHRGTLKNNTTGSMNVSVHSQGLNYVGSHRNDVIVDSHPPGSSATTFIALKKPAMGTSAVLLSAFDECGNVCQPECISEGSIPVRYHPCTGVLKVTSQDPVMYMETVPDALHGVSKKSTPEVTESLKDIRIVFRCLCSDLSIKPGT